MNDAAHPPVGDQEANGQPVQQGPRIDKWLWYARFFKTRTLASKVCNGGKLRVNSAPIAKAHHRVRLGDVLTFPQANSIRVVEVLAFGERRGPAPEAQLLYRDLAPPEPKKQQDPTTDAVEPGVPARDAGAGRPTKADRRAIDRLRDRDQS